MSTALVLSAGGMFGAWQAGVWRALAPRFTPDLVIGTSAGALNGWAIAGGAGPGELEAAWLEADLADMIRPRFPGRSLFDPERLARTAKEIFRRYRPKLEFALTVVEVPRLRLRVIRGEDVRWQHLAASCAIPLGFPPVRIDGRRYVDGDVLSVLPVWAAAELGAARVVAVDALPVLPSRLLRATVGSARWLGETRAAPQGLPVTVIRPGQSLGLVRDALYWNAANAHRWIAQGQRDGEAGWAGLPDCRP